MTKLLVTILIWTIRTMFRSKHDFQIENLVLRQQLAVFKEKHHRPRLSNADRAFWVAVRDAWSRWTDALIVVKPDTVVRWHRRGFRYYWHWKSRTRDAGRPKIDREIRTLIRRMSIENVTWGAPRIHGELLKLGYELDESTVSRYMARTRKPPSQSWRGFLTNHAREIVGCDFFTVPTATFRLLFVFILLSHDRRKILHFNVTGHPSAEWTGRQVVQAFPYDTAPKYLLRDRDSTYGNDFRRQIEALGIEQIVIARESPWQNPFAERVIGTVRRDCLDHCIVLNERHLRRLLREYADYYNAFRTHLSLEKDCPEHRAVELPESGEIESWPVLGGLHHRYFRRAA